MPENAQTHTLDVRGFMVPKTQRRKPIIKNSVSLFKSYSCMDDPNRTNLYGYLYGSNRLIFNVWVV